MKRILQALCFASLCLGTNQLAAQSFPFNDDFESYTAFQVPNPPYNGDITVYLVHGTNSSQGLASYMTTFSTADSIITPLIGPIPSDCKLTFDWRIVDPLLYPATPATLGQDDSFDVFASTDGINFNPFYTINQWNYQGDINFASAVLSMDNYLGQSIYIMFAAHRGSGSNEFWLDIDNISIDQLNTVAKPSSAEFQVYPTIASDVIHIKNSGASTITAAIYDTQARLVKSVQVNRGDNTLSVASLAEGMYYIHAGSEVRKIVVGSR